MVYIIFKVKIKFIIFIKIKKWLNKYNFYIHYIEVLDKLTTTFENFNNKNISKRYYNILFQNNIYFREFFSKFIRLNSEL